MVIDTHSQKSHLRHRRVFFSHIYICTAFAGNRGRVGDLCCPARKLILWLIMCKFRMLRYFLRDKHRNMGSSGGGEISYIRKL